MNIEGQCLPECITYQNSIKNFNGICPICNRFYGSNLECHIGKEHKALTRDLKAVFQNILSIEISVRTKWPRIGLARLSEVERTFLLLRSSTVGLKLSFLNRYRFFSSRSRFISSLETSEKFFKNV